LIDGGIDAAHDVDVLRVLPEAGGDLLACDQIAAPRYEKLEQVDARSREPEPDAAPAQLLLAGFQFKWTELEKSRLSWDSLLSPIKFGRSRLSTNIAE